MRVGLFFDLRNPPAWAVSPSRLYGFTLEMCEEAERLGCHSIWVTEHHGFDDGYLPQPLTMAAAIAARTRRVRIGTGIAVAPFYHPVHLAEQAAIVDILSDGRFDLGLGCGYRVPEFEMFGADISRRYSATDERVRQIRRLWSEGGITPRPVQQPPPIWMGYQGPQSARRAGRLGECLLALDPFLWPHYRDGLIEAGHDPAKGRMAGWIEGYVSEDPEAVWPLAAKHAAHQINSYLRYAAESAGRPPPPPGPLEDYRRRPGGTSLSYCLCTTPKDAAAQIRAYTTGAPVEEVILWGSLGGMPEAMTAEHVRVICTKLAPLLADHHPTGPL
jgi:alkanesulfonate monooxygenase SsuD/methylene tetrahydromethanopterin reductase-like flavin-dependent oxidoreductase (luciferase family)